MSQSHGSSPCWSKLSQKTIEGLECKLNGRALGAALQCAPAQLRHKNRASLTDSTRIQTPHSFFRDFCADKPSHFVGLAAEFKFESKFEPLQVIWQSPRRLSQKTIVGFDCKINCQSLVAELRHGLGRLGEHKHRTFQSRLQSLPATICLLEEKVLPLLQY